MCKIYELTNTEICLVNGGISIFPIPKTLVTASDVAAAGALFGLTEFYLFNKKTSRSAKAIIGFTIGLIGYWLLPFISDSTTKPADNDVNN